MNFELSIFKESESLIRPKVRVARFKYICTRKEQRLYWKRRVESPQWVVSGRPGMSAFGQKQTFQRA